MPTNLDFSQVIQRAYDEANNRLRVDAEISASIIAPPGLEVSISSDDDNIAIRNTSNNNELLINPDGSINVVASLGVSSVDQGSPNTAANAWPVKLTDGSDTASINADGSINVANVTSVVSSTAVLATLASSTSTQVALAANSDRKGFLLFNDSTTNCFVAFAATASTSTFTMKLIPGMTYQNEAIIYTGIISAIWDSANGNLRITELVT